MNAAIPSRNPWPIAIVAYFALFITFIVSFVTFASRQPVELIGGDYYDQEIRYQQQIDRLARTRAVKSDLRAGYDASQQCFKVVLPPGHLKALSKISAHLYRPSDFRLDRDLTVERLPDGSLRLGAERLQAGLWKLRFGWTAGTNEFFLEEPVVISPAAP